MMLSRDYINWLLPSGISSGRYYQLDSAAQVVSDYHKVKKTLMYDVIKTKNVTVDFLSTNDASRRTPDRG